AAFGVAAFAAAGFWAAGCSPALAFLRMSPLSVDMWPVLISMPNFSLIQGFISDGVASLPFAAKALRTASILEIVPDWTGAVVVEVVLPFVVAMTRSMSGFARAMTASDSTAPTPRNGSSFQHEGAGGVPRGGVP